MITDGGSIDALPRSSSLQRQLTFTIQHIAYLLPIDQILGMIDGNTWKILERRIDQIVVITHPANGGVWMIAWDNGIAQLLCKSYKRAYEKKREYNNFFHCF